MDTVTYSIHQNVPRSPPSHKTSWQCVKSLPSWPVNCLCLARFWRTRLAVTYCWSFKPNTQHCICYIHVYYIITIYGLIQIPFCRTISMSVCLTFVYRNRSCYCIAFLKNKNFSWDGTTHCLRSSQTKPLFRTFCSTYTFTSRTCSPRN